jgi:hypothetical protein
VVGTMSDSAAPIQRFVWPRTCCVYCGRPTRERDPRNTRRPFSMLACWRHVDLLKDDPNMPWLWHRRNVG